MSEVHPLPGVTMLGAYGELAAEILPLEALKFVTDLERNFGAKRRELLAARAMRQNRLDSVERPDFLHHTVEIVGLVDSGPRACRFAGSAR